MLTRQCYGLIAHSALYLTIKKNLNPIGRCLFLFGYYVTNQKVCRSHHVVDRRRGLRGAWPDTAGARESCGRIWHCKDAFRHWRCRCQRKVFAVDGPIQACKWRLCTRHCRAVSSPPALAVISANNPRVAVTATSYGGVIVQSGRTLRCVTLRYVTLSTTTVYSISEAPT